MNFQPLDLAAPGIAGLRPYVPGKPISELERELGITGSIKLASNENPLGPSPKALARRRRRSASSRATRTAAASSCGRRSPRSTASTATASPWATARTTCST